MVDKGYESNSSHDHRSLWVVDNDYEWLRLWIKCSHDHRDQEWVMLGHIRDRNIHCMHDKGYGWNCRWMNNVTGDAISLACQILFIGTDSVLMTKVLFCLCVHADKASCSLCMSFVILLQRWNCISWLWVCRNTTNALKPSCLVKEDCFIEM